jgi:hypothetical protein
MSDTEQLIEFYEKYAKDMGIRFVEKKHWGIFNTYLRYVLNRYLKKYSVLVPNLSEVCRPKILKNIVILDYNIGDSEVGWKKQLSVAVHEGEHALHMRDFISKGGRIADWYLQYFRDREFRAVQEGGAIATEAELEYALSGKIPSLPSLEEYLVGDAGQKLSDQTYQKRIDRIKELGKGASTSASSMRALKILRSMDII